MPFSMNKTGLNYNSLALHGYVNNKVCNPQNCKTIKMFALIQYLGVIFDNNLRWNFHINNLLRNLWFVTYKLVKLKNMDRNK